MLLEVVLEVLFEVRVERLFEAMLERLREVLRPLVDVPARRLRRLRCRSRGRLRRLTGLRRLGRHRDGGESFAAAPPLFFAARDGLAAEHDVAAERLQLD